MSNAHVDGSVYAGLYLQAGIDRLRRNEFVYAVAEFDAAIAISPNDPYAHWNKAMALLSLGDYRNGFHEHEWGWRLFNWRGFGPVRGDIDRLQMLPLWDGRPGQRLLLYHELGFGDAIMCMRYLPALQRACTVTLVIDEGLRRLAKQFVIEVVTKVPQDLHAFDCRLPFFGVMAALNQTVETIPREPYIRADWLRTGGRIGLVWSGRTQTMFSAEQFIALLRPPAHAHLYALQPGPTPPDVQPLEAQDFADTVSVLEQMDHVVSVDTAVAHLAGALGHPSTHVVIPFCGDWRWWNVEAWYPTVKVYRQKHSGCDWSEPFARVRAAIAED